MTKVITVRPNGTKRVVTINDEPSRTQKQFQDAVNVNKIMERYLKTGTVTHIRNQAEGVYADLTGITDYQSALNQVMHANQKFLDLPSKIRLRFENDPKKLIEFLQNPANLEESVELGLRHKSVLPPPKNEELPKNVEAPKSKE